MQRAQWQCATISMYGLQCTGGVHASSALHRIGLVQRLQCNLLAQWPRYNLHRQISPKEAALYKVCCSLSATQESNVQPAAVLYRSNYFWAKADLLRVLRKGDNPRLEFRACLKSNSMKATAYKNFLQRRSVQIKAKQWTHGTGF